MHKILSIDFDWIMEPSIEIYNPISGIHMDWDWYREASPKVLLPADLDKFYQLYKLLKYKQGTMKPGSIFATKEHVQMADRGKLWIENATDDIIIYNVDHHHDLGYGYDSVSDMEEANSGNWALYLMQQYPNKIKKYVWIGNKKSMVPCDWITKIGPEYEQTLDLDPLNYIDFDEIFLCLSPDYVPTEYYNLFHILEDTLDLTVKK